MVLLLTRNITTDIIFGIIYSFFCFKGVMACIIQYQHVPGGDIWLLSVSSEGAHVSHAQFFVMDVDCKYLAIPGESCQCPSCSPGADPYETLPQWHVKVSHMCLLLIVLCTLGLLSVIQSFNFKVLCNIVSEMLETYWWDYKASWTHTTATVLRWDCHSGPQMWRNRQLMVSMTK